MTSSWSLYRWSVYSSVKYFYYDSIKTSVLPERWKARVDGFISTTFANFLMTERNEHSVPNSNAFTSILQTRIIIRCLHVAFHNQELMQCYQYLPHGIITNISALHWHHNDPDGVSNHQHHGCLLNRLFRCRSKETSKLRVTGLCVGNSPGPGNSPHKGPVTRKVLPFDDVSMV